MNSQVKATVFEQLLYNKASRRCHQYPHLNQATNNLKCSKAEPLRCASLSTIPHGPAIHICRRRYRGRSPLLTSSTSTAHSRWRPRRRSPVPGGRCIMHIYISRSIITRHLRISSRSAIALPAIPAGWRRWHRLHHLSSFVAAETTSEYGEE